MPCNLPATHNDCSVFYENETHHILGFALRPHINHSTPSRASHLFQFPESCSFRYVALNVSFFCLLPCCLLLEEISPLQSCLLNNPPTDLEERGKPDQLRQADAIRAQLLTVTIKTNLSATEIKQHVRQVKEKNIFAHHKINGGTHFHRILWRTEIEIIF